MSYEEQIDLVGNAYHHFQGIESINLTSSRQENGAVGIIRKEDGYGIPNASVKDWNYVSYPSAPVLASTFNIDIVKNIGEHISEDMLYLGYNGIYGPCGNLHRTPFGGRNWENFSEDSFLCGVISSSLVQGIQSLGNIAYVKHFAFNDTETNRRHVAIYSNEQAAREIYLRPFEILFKEGKAKGTMTSLTRCGTKWTSMCSPLLEGILRQEWGFKGIVITDLIRNEFMSPVDAILSGTNALDATGKPSTYFKGFEKDPRFAAKLRDSVKCIIYNITKTNAYNGVTRENIVVHIIPAWEITFYYIDGFFFFGFCISLILLCISFRSLRKEKSL